jgi:hypothetical protein
MQGLLALPTDVLVEISRYLFSAELAALSEVSVWFKDFANTHTWKERVEHRFGSSHSPDDGFGTALVLRHRTLSALSETESHELRRTLLNVESVGRDCMAN